MSSYINKCLIVCLAYLASLPLSANTEGTAPPKIGNFAVSITPSSLIGFGQHIIPKNEVDLFLYTDSFVGKKKHNVEIIPQLVYGMTDDFAVTLSVPIAANFKYDKNHSSGIEDMFVQTEYAFYSNKTCHYTELATLVTSVSFPTGSTKKNPNTGLGASAFLLGGTYNRTYTDWFGFTSPGVILTTSHEGTKVGNQFLYQVGLGRNIYSVPSEWTVALMAELTGNYSQKSKVRGLIDPNSGGTLINLTPSLWISSNNLLIQVGVGFPVAYHLNGKQHKNEYLIATNVGCSF